MQPQSRAFKASDTLLPVQLLKKKIAYSELAKSQQVSLSGKAD